MCEAKIGKLKRVIAQFYEMVPIRRIYCQCDVSAGELDIEAQRFLLSETVGSSLSHRYPPNIQYQRAFIKKLLNTLKYACLRNKMFYGNTCIGCKQLEEGGVDICDEMYEAFTELLQRTDTEDDSLCYKTYTLEEGVQITIKESVHMISVGTTGLNTWQAAQHLAEWALQNKHLLENKHVLELGCGLGLTGLAVCRQCCVGTYTFTDCHSQVLDLLHHNIQLNFHEQLSGVLVTEQGVQQGQSSSVGIKQVDKSVGLQEKERSLRLRHENTGVGVQSVGIEQVDKNVKCKESPVNGDEGQALSSKTLDGNTLEQELHLFTDSSSLFHSQFSSNALSSGCYCESSSCHLIHKHDKVNLESELDCASPDFDINSKEDAHGSDLAVIDSCKVHSSQVEGDQLPQHDTCIYESDCTDSRCQPGVSGLSTLDHWKNIVRYTVKGGAAVQLVCLDWENLDRDLVNQLADVDIILAADVVYDVSIIPALVSVLTTFLKDRNQERVAYIASTIRNEDTRDQFLIELGAADLLYEPVDPPSLQLFNYDRSLPIEILKVTSTPCST